MIERRHRSASGRPPRRRPSPWPRAPRWSACTTAARWTRCVSRAQSPASGFPRAMPSLAMTGGWEGAIESGRADGRLVAEGVEAARRAENVGIPLSLASELAAALRRSGIDSLYSHQLEALEAAAGDNVVITSGTASGKSLSFNLPVLDSLVRDSGHRALY